MIIHVNAQVAKVVGIYQNTAALLLSLSLFGQQCWLPLKMCWEVLPRASAYKVYVHVNSVNIE